MYVCMYMYCIKFYMCILPQGWISFCRYCVASIKPIICNIFTIFIIIGILTVSIYDPHSEVNLTMEPETTGTDVVKAVVSQIKASSFFENDYSYDYVRRIAWVESEDGLRNETYRKDYHGGLWQVDEPLFLVTQNTSIPVLINKHNLVKTYFDTDWMTLQWRDLRIPLWSGLAVCLYMCTVDEEIPSDVTKQANHWNIHYNSKKENRQKPEKFIFEVKELEANASGMYGTGVEESVKRG